VLSDELAQAIQVSRPRKAFAMRTIEDEPPPDGIRWIVGVSQTRMRAIPSHVLSFAATIDVEWTALALASANAARFREGGGLPETAIGSFRPDRG
jgi:hypothetical protein